MASRRDTLQRKTELRQALIQTYRDGGLGAEEMLPPLQELAKAHNISVPTARQVIRELVQEGILYTRSTAGTFVRRPQSIDGSTYLLVMPTKKSTFPHIALVRSGFEERVAQFGVSLCLEQQIAEKWQAERILPDYVGFFEFDVSALEIASQAVHKVKFGKLSRSVPEMDAVTFDDVDGGYQATTHLLQAGHSRIAFLGLSTEQNKEEEDIYLWSRERELGWKRALNQAGLNSQNLVFQGRVALAEVHEWEAQRQTAYEAARELIKHKEITAVVSVNSHATAGLIMALREARIADEHWPAVVSFDESPYHSFGDEVYDSSHIISALRQSWEEIGREAANILWERSQGRLTGPAQQRLVPMRLIPRLSSRREWPRAIRLGQSVHHSLVSAV